MLRFSSARYTGHVGTTRLDDDDPVAFYLRHVGAIPALTRDEEIELYQHVLANQQADFAAKRLIDSNLAMVVSIAEGHRDAGMHVLELIQEGNEGLMLALRTYRGDSGESFSACIEAAIAGALAK